MTGDPYLWTFEQTNLLEITSGKPRCKYIVSVLLMPIENNLINKVIDFFTDSSLNLIDTLIIWTSCIHFKYLFHLYLFS